MVILSGTELSVEQVRAVAIDDVPVEISEEAVGRMHASRATVERLAAGEAPVYAVNTGVGLLADVRIEPKELEHLQRNVVRSHAVGVGPLLPREVVRAMMLIRANVLAIGCSGIRPLIAQKLCALLNHGITPCVPSKGQRRGQRRPGAAGAHGAGADRRR